MATTNITISKTAYALIASAGAKGVYSNPNSDFIEIAYDSAPPLVTLKGHPVPPLVGDDFRNSAHATDNLYAKLVDDAESDSGVVAVSLGF